ncbi:proton-conducting transporter transmembrane domain-containing protein [Ilumatobacter coccineus]|uniref:Na(+)/H(+) antiporter subunit D n=1 Tax=Ilumatobacter coccineus (strain NBRC 103263 / KCTC 29153 / YM16-304) TaxID=1313172 RepID=A0A6C7ECR1_ILUCY|nr:proton-conducting transporter membrane subunit [Ilumatobacter coccineus]BAN04113.1 Na(+)/H(+) antiporter subunit D [Ilumatobacter coccineus YM16-304]
MSALVSLCVVVPLLGAMITLGLRTVGRLRDVITLGSLAATSVMAIVLLVHVEANDTVVVRVGEWAPQLGIVLVADMFAVLVLGVAVLTITIVELFAMGQRRSASGADPTIVGPMLLVLTAGVTLSILTGDLFTLFVAFELMLVASYVLLTHQGRAGQVRSGMTYVVINLFASTLFLFGVAFVYAATGTVNMAELAERIPELSNGVRWGIGLWFLVVFGTKAAMFPLFSWLPDSYPTAPTTITAVFAGLLTKVGVYVMIRFHVLTEMDQLGPVILVIAGFTMLVGVAGALAQDDMKRILSFHIVSQIGYMLMGLGLFSVAGVAGAIIFIVHQIPVKTVLFLVGGLVETERGTSSLERAGGLIAKRPWIAALFALPALSLAGLPPFSGFVAKLALLDAGVADGSTIIVVAALVASALTSLSMVKIWLGVFWGSGDDHPEVALPERVGSGPGRLMFAATGAALALTLTIAVVAGPLWSMSERAATELLDGDVYVDTVLGDTVLEAGDS